MFEFNQDTVNQYGMFGAFVGAILSAFITIFLYKGVPAFFNYLTKRAEIKLANEETENQTQQVENKKDLALIHAQQVLENENVELRETKRSQATTILNLNQQILDQANEISRLKNFVGALDECRESRRQLINWIIEEEFLDKDALIEKLRVDILIMESMLFTDDTKDK
jgi:hypothetical protein